MILFLPYTPKGGERDWRRSVKFFLPFSGGGLGVAICKKADLFKHAIFCRVEKKRHKELLLLLPAVRSLSHSIFPDPHCAEQSTWHNPSSTASCYMLWWWEGTILPHEILPKCNSFGGIYCPWTNKSSSCLAHLSFYTKNFQHFQETLCLFCAYCGANSWYYILKFFF